MKDWSYVQYSSNFISVATSHTWIFPKIILDSLTDFMGGFMIKFDLWMIWIDFLILIYGMIPNDFVNGFLDII